MHFTKMQGLGNDYLYVYGAVPENAPALSVRLSDRHFGPGSDGMIWISPSDKADFSMRIFNADGSEARMCGNGIRCVGKYVYDKGYTDKTRLTIETLAGLRTLELHTAGGRVKTVTVDMGRAEASPEMRLEADGTEVRCTPVDVGNPHAVVFVEDAEDAPLYTLGPKIEKHPAFPGAVNVEFIQVLEKNHLRMRVWERGSGVTLACGTGACASSAAAVRRGYCGAGMPIRVELDGGVLDLEVSPQGDLRMTGPCEFVYEGDVELC
ncbi:MAG: diaminopimelate epimerase [Oscillospiraceae bacterium]|nr:diaminopimelate epimerase [Oscillospiraceae bacterium]